MSATLRSPRWATLLVLSLPACSIEVGGSSPFARIVVPDAATEEDAGGEPVQDGAMPPMEASTADASDADADHTLADVEVSPVEDAHAPPVDAHADASDSEPGDGEPADAGELTNPGEPDGCVQPLTLFVRDFQDGHPDFPKLTISSAGLVAEQLGSDHKPVRAQRVLLTGPYAFEQWFHDTPGINQRIDLSFAIEQPEPGRFVFERTPFFPIDGQAFGNGPGRLGLLPGIARGVGATHNFLFTTEGHLRFVYQGGETLTFTSNDDVWVFINGQLALDMGATYRAESATVTLDTMAAQLRIEKGKVYALDVFHAARSLAESRYRLETTLDLGCLAE